MLFLDSRPPMGNNGDEEVWSEEVWGEQVWGEQVWGEEGRTEG